MHYIENQNIIAILRNDYLVSVFFQPSIKTSHKTIPKA